MRITPEFAADPTRLVAIAAFLGVCVLVASPPIEWLPPTGAATGLLGALLAAQAAIAALSLAVVLFALERVSARPDADDRIFDEYVRRLWMRRLFVGSLGAVAATGSVLLAEEFARGGIPVAEATPGASNLVLVAATAFFASVALAAVLFERTVRLTRPSAWRALRSDVNEQNVRDSVQAFLRRRERVIAKQEAGDLDLADTVPGPGEGSADEAVRALLDDARRAMDERRQADFQDALDAITGLVEYAMGEMEAVSITWNSPGAQPEWPPLRELSENLYAFREEVIGHGNREYVFSVLRLDYWLLTNGLRRRCGELFTVGLDGYWWNYQIANRAGTDEIRELLRDRVWQVARFTVLGESAEELFPYVQQMVRHQERALSDAVNAGRPVDYERLHRAFTAVLDGLRRDWDARSSPTSAPALLYERLAQQYRIALVGLAGRAMLLGESGAISDVTPFVGTGRGVYGRFRELADDLAGVLGGESRQRQWSDWEMEGAGDLEVRSVQPERYALTFFSVRLIEVASDTMSVGLHGHASRVLDWFTANVGGLLQHAQLAPDVSAAQQREFAVTALRESVRIDVVAADEEVIGRALSADRIVAFTADVYASAFMENAVEQMFDQAGAVRYLPHDANDAPESRRAQQFREKGFFAEEPDDALTHYGNPDVQSWATSMVEDATRRLIEALTDAPEIRTPLDSPEELLDAVDAALVDLQSDGPVLLLLAGDWSQILTGLAVRHGDRYQEAWDIPAADRAGDAARLDDHGLVWQADAGPRALFIVELGAWGCFVRAQVEGATDLRVDVEAITPERARELVEATPELFPDELDEASKLRKVQTFVSVEVGARTEFRIVDASRARRIVPLEPTD